MIRIYSCFLRLTATAVTLFAVTYLSPSFATAENTKILFKPEESLAPLLPNDPLFAKQWNLETYDGLFSQDYDINISEAWKHTKGSPKVIIAEVSNGIDYKHEDLKANLWKNTDEIPNNGKDDDNNGYIDDIHGWNFIQDNNNPQDGSGWGTSMVGIYGAKPNNNKGIAGICPECQIMPVRTMNGDVQIADGLMYAVDNGADIIHMPWLPTHYNYLVNNALEYAAKHDILVVTPIAASTCSDPETSSMQRTSDGATMLPKVLTVAGTTKEGKRWNDANCTTWIDVSAPNQDIQSIDLNNNYALDTRPGFASAHAAGIAGLVKAMHPELTPRQLISLFQSSVRPFSSTENYRGIEVYVGTGIIDAKQAVEETFFPVAVFNPVLQHINLRGELPIIGSVYGEEVSGFRIELGEGFAYPDTWETVCESNEQVHDNVLCTLDTSRYNPGSYQLRLVVKSKAGREKNQDVAIFRNEVEFDCFDNQNASHVAVGEIDPISPGLEFVHTIGLPHFFGDILACHQDGTLVHGFPRRIKGVNGWENEPVTLADIDSDGFLEILINGASSSSIQVLNHDGTNAKGQWPVDFHYKNAISSPAVVADINRDGHLDVLTSVNGDGVRGYDRFGELFLNVTPPPGAASGTALTVTDVDKNGDLEFAVSWHNSGNEMVTLYNHDGTMYPGAWPVHVFGENLQANDLILTEFIAHESSKKEVIGLFCAQTGYRQDPSCELHVWTDAGEPVTSWPQKINLRSNIPEAEYFHSCMTAGKLSPDKGAPPSIVVYTHGELRVFDGSGALRFSPLFFPSIFSCSEPLIGDFHEHPGQEILLALRPTRFDPLYSSGLYLISEDGQIISKHLVYSGGYSGALAADVNSDGYLEIMATRYSGGSSELDKNYHSSELARHRVIRFDWEYPWNEEEMSWPRFRQNLYRTGAKLR